MNPSAEVSRGNLVTRSHATAVLAALAVALVVSVSLNILLAHKLRSLNSLHSARMTERLLKVGVTVPPITANRLDGRQEVISYQRIARPTFVSFFTPPAAAC